MTTCAVGSADVGLLAYFLAACLGTGGGGLRAAPALLALALIACGVRQRRPRLFFYAAVATALAGFTSLDFAAYTGIALLAATTRFRPGSMRRSAVSAAAAGLITTGGIAAAGLALSGIAIDFFRSTVFEIVSVGSAYALTPFNAPEVLRKYRFPPELLVGFFDRTSFSFIFWALCLVAVAVVLAVPSGHLSPLRRFKEALLILAVWVVVAGVSYAERQHTYVLFLAAPVASCAVALLSARRIAAYRSGAVLLTVLLLMLAQPTAYLSVIDMLRHAHGPLARSLVEVDEIPRARGVLYTAKDAATIRSVQKYVASSLRVNETFFDFTNRGVLYFLLNRDCPIRQVEVAFYEREQQQREVIDRIRNNPRIRSALIPKDGDTSTMVDAVPNRKRAPLVWEYLRQHFRPDFEEGDVVFWRRVDG